MGDDSRLGAFSISMTVLGIRGRSISTAGSVFQANRITTLMFRSHWPSWKHQNSSDTTLRAPITGFQFSATTRIWNISRYQKCAPEDKPGGRKLFRLMTLSLNTSKAASARPKAHPDGPTTQSATKELRHEYWHALHWNHTTISCWQSSRARLPTHWRSKSGQSLSTTQ